MILEVWLKSSSVYYKFVVCTNVERALEFQLWVMRTVFHKLNRLRLGQKLKKLILVIITWTIVWLFIQVDVIALIIFTSNTEIASFVDIKDVFRFNFRPWGYNSSQLLTRWEFRKTPAISYSSCSFWNQWPSAVTSLLGSIVSLVFVNRLVTCGHLFCLF